MKKLLSILIVLSLLITAMPFSIIATAEDLFGTQTEENWGYEVVKRKAVINYYDAEIDGKLEIPSTLGGYPVTEIGESAFSDCTGLTEITIPDSVKTIGESAFYGCTGLTKITLPNSVKTIGESAFADCTGLTEIIIPASVKLIDSYSFSDCAGLELIAVDKNNEVYYSTGNCLIERETNVLMLGCKNSVIPDTVTAIGNAAFSGCEGLTEIKIPDSVTSIGYGAFSDCTGLTEIIIPNFVTDVSDGVFAGCTSLTKVKLPDNATEIWSSAFSGCTALTEITIPPSVKEIGGYAFYYCTGLTEVEIPDSVIHINDAAFVGCENLTGIIIPDSVKTIGENAFFGCKSLTEIEIPNSVTEIGTGAFAYCAGLKKAIISASLYEFDMSAFIGCWGLESLEVFDNEAANYYSENNCIIERDTDILVLGCKNSVIPDFVEEIGEAAFASCLGLIKIKIPASVIYIEPSAFLGCWDLETFEIDEKNEYYFSSGNCIIEKDTNMLICGCKKSIIPDFVTRIGEFAFSTCLGLRKITIPESVTEIGESAFSSCENLSKITILSSFADIESSAFSSCSSITDIYYVGTKEEWERMDPEFIFDNLDGVNIHYNFNPTETPNDISKPEPNDAPIMIRVADGYIFIAGSLSVEQIQEVYEISGIIVTDANGDIIEDGGAIGTGAVTEVYYGKNLIEQKVMVLKGDINGDGKVKTTDARNALRGALSLDELNDVQILAADVNNDGNLKATDARAILRGAMGLENMENWLG
ncbi:MAG TPA: leucine-rich repeat protein [Clostridiales bacterium]|nr:leucine-rich repeat protein [Clostridiales bacterium]